MDQAALLRALRTGHVAGASLDVFEADPLPETNPFWDGKNLIISPHCSAVCDGWQGDFTLFLDNLARWREREVLRNIVNPARGYQKGQTLLIALRISRPFGSPCQMAHTWRRVIRLR